MQPETKEQKKERKAAERAERHSGELEAKKEECNTLGDWLRLAL